MTGILRRSFVLLLATAVVIGCGTSQQSAQDGGGSHYSPTAPSLLKRTVDDVPGESSGGTETTTTGCDAPPCTPGPEPRPQPVHGDFTVWSADGSTIVASYETKTAASGIPLSLVGNGGGSSFSTFVDGTGRFANVSTGIFAVEFQGASQATLSLKWSIAKDPSTGGYRSYGDSGLFPYSSEKKADGGCASGQRFRAVISGKMESLGRFTATLNHCVSLIQ